MESTEINASEMTEVNATSLQEQVQQPGGQPVVIPAELNQQQALQVLVDAARIAQSKGVFTLDDAELVNKAIKAFVPKGPVSSNQ